jgi:hypothetical protein
MVRKFGNPVTGQQPPITASVQLVDNSPSTDISVAFGNMNADGIATITTNVNVSQLTLPPPRVPLDSEVYFVAMNINVPGGGESVGDSEAPLSVLLFNAYTAPANPTWNDVSAIFGAYARMYPGMKSRFDISDQSTVMGNPETVLDHMAVEITDPSYMPVTRDLSPAKVAMIISWLKTQIQS